MVTVENWPLSNQTKAERTLRILLKRGASLTSLVTLSIPKAVEWKSSYKTIAVAFFVQAVYIICLYSTQHLVELNKYTVVIISLLRVHLAISHLLSITMFCLLGAGNFNLTLILRLKSQKCNDPCEIILISSRTFLEESHWVVQEFTIEQRNFTSHTKIQRPSVLSFPIFTLQAIHILIPQHTKKERNRENLSRSMTSKWL